MQCRVKGEVPGFGHVAGDRSKEEGQAGQGKQSMIVQSEIFGWL